MSRQAAEALRLNTTSRLTSSRITSASPNRKTPCGLQTKAYSRQTGQQGIQMGLRERFEREAMSEVKVRYRLTVSGTDLDGRQPMLTENAYAPVVWYRGYLKEGAGECH
ncbi:MAG: hypothetical protein AB7U82_34295 [Blastocatellales bacterium]